MPFSACLTLCPAASALGQHHAGMPSPQAPSLRSSRRQASMCRINDVQLSKRTAHLVT